MNLTAGKIKFNSAEVLEFAITCASLPSYREIPTFGGDTIRRFSRNVSEMKKLAARDFADILQVSKVAFAFFSPVCNF